MISSADWMDRNFFRRIELAVPILDAKARKRVFSEGFKPYLEDNMHAWEMQPDGTFKRLKPGRKKRVSAQQELLKALAG
jgi:polyphosphate kinase